MKKAKHLSQFIIRCLLWVLALIYIFPLLLIFTNSFMPEAEIERHYKDEAPVYAAQPGSIHYAEYSLIPDRVTLEQYYSLLFKSPVYLDYFLNSVKITAPIVILQLLFGTISGYAFSFGRFRFKEVLFALYIVVMLLPFQATSVANFIIAQKLNISDSYLAIILPAAFSPFPVFIMRQSMKGVHPDIINAAKMDGAGEVQILLKILVPLAKGGIISLFLLSFCECWSIVEQAVVFIRDAGKEPLSLFLSDIGADNMGLIFAASVFYMLPAVWLFVYGQEYFERGLKLSVIN
ncbi:MAG: carbohydrate ABC transporter permease [Clostridiales bacterium]|jgi:multiple sugar transport system permease protein|nr:carbohydrate ABC transporter permease [Clostridiales bacterium]